MHIITGLLLQKKEEKKERKKKRSICVCFSTTNEKKNREKENYTDQSVTNKIIKVAVLNGLEATNVSNIILLLLLLLYRFRHSNRVLHSFLPLRTLCTLSKSTLCFFEVQFNSVVASNIQHKFFHPIND